MTPYITYRDKDEKGNLQYYILQRNFPHFVSVISAIPKTGTWQSAVAGYNLWVIFNGTLRGNMIPDYKNISEEIQMVLDSMAGWYCSERIVPDPKRFKKFKIISNASSGVQ